MSKKISKKVNSKREIVKGKDVFIGIDVHSKNWVVNMRSEDTEVFHAMIPPRYDVLRKLLKRCPGCRFAIAYEAGPHGFNLYDQVAGEGHDCLVTPPTAVLSERNNRIKTDKRDARKLAMLLEKGLLKRVYVLSPEERAHRQLVRTRRQIVEHRSAVAHQIQSLLLYHGIRSPFPEDKRWSTIYMTWLREAELPYNELTDALRILVTLYDQLSEHIKVITRQVMALSKIEKYQEAVALLDSIPGVGPLSAFEMVVELQDMTRFETPGQLASYIGLVPSERTSDEHSTKGGITHMGNSRVRTALIEDSWVLIKQEEHWRQRYEMIKYRRGGYKAIVAIARKLLEVIWTMYQTGEQYRRQTAA